MRIEAREAQILRVWSRGIHPGLSAKLSESLRLSVVSTVKTVMEGALEEELSQFLSEMAGKNPQRSGIYPRGLNTQYGRIKDLQVPKLRERNANVADIGALSA
jgi:transposase-like protein